MDVVILAAGEGSRLNGVTAPYMKPLLVLDRKPMIVHALERAYETAQGTTILHPKVVCSPRNVDQVVDVVEANGFDMTRIIFMVQPRPNGPAQALHIGLEAVHAEAQVMVLCADNIIPVGLCGDLTIKASVDGARHIGLVCGRNLVRSEALRFTWWDNSHKMWREHDEDYDMPPGCEIRFVWLGPLVLPSCEEFYAAIGSNELIGPTLNAVKDWTRVEADCHDVGVPEAIS